MGARLQRKFATNVVCQLVRKFRLRGERRVPQNYFYMICPRVRVCVSLAWRAFGMGSRTKHQFHFPWASPRGRRRWESKSLRCESRVLACVCNFTRQRSWTLATPRKVAVSMCARKSDVNAKSVWNIGSPVWLQRYSSMSWFRYGHTNYVNVNKVCYSRCLRGVVVPMLMHRPLSFFSFSPKYEWLHVL